jgi:DNA repair protein RadC
MPVNVNSRRQPPRTRDSLRLLDIALVDHIIAGAHSFVSMKRKALI